MLTKPPSAVPEAEEVVVDSAAVVVTLVEVAAVDMGEEDTAEEGIAMVSTADLTQQLALICQKAEEATIVKEAVVVDMTALVEVEEVVVVVSHFLKCQFLRLTFLGYQGGGGQSYNGSGGYQQGGGGGRY